MLKTTSLQSSSMGTCISLQSGGTASNMVGLICTKLEQRKSCCPKRVMSSCCNFNISSMVLAPQTASSAYNCSLMLLVLMKSPLIAVNVLVDKVLMWCHTLLLPPHMSLTVPQQTFCTVSFAIICHPDEYSFTWQYI